MSTDTLVLHLPPSLLMEPSNRGTAIFTETPSHSRMYPVEGPTPISDEAARLLGALFLAISRAPAKQDTQVESHFNLISDIVAPGHSAVEEQSALLSDALEHSAAEVANADRIRLLARSYVHGKLSTEDDARLQILSERVRLLIPRFTATDLEQLEVIASDIADIRKEDLALREQLGISDSEK